MYRRDEYGELRKVGYFVNPGWERPLTLDDYCERILKPAVESLKFKIGMSDMATGVGEKQMTKQEAIATIDMNFKDRMEAGRFIRSLEALGLIKFEEEKEDNGAANCIGFTYWNLRDSVNSKSDLTKVGREFVNDLEKSGYQIVKVGQKGLKFKAGNGHYVVYDEFLDQS